jgi:hypothetical protein
MIHALAIATMALVCIAPVVLFVIDVISAVAPPG